MTVTAAYNSSILIGSLPSVAFTDEATTSSDLTTFSISTATKRYFDKSVATVVQAQYDETQLITVTGSPTGGTFTLTFGANTTGNIAYNAAASAVQTALQGLSSIGAGNALVTGSNGGPWTVEFAGSLAKTAEALITLNNNSLTGGSSPSVSITRVQGGATWATITSGFTLFRCGARVVFASAQPAGTQVRFHSGNYIPYATLVEAQSCDFSGKMGMEDSTLFGSTGAHAYTPTTLTGTMKLGLLWASNARLTSMKGRELLIGSFVLPSGNRYEGFIYASDIDLKGDVNKLITQDITVQITDEFFNP